MGLLEQHIDHDDNELVDVDRTFIEIETFLDPCQYLRLQFFKQLMLEIDIQNRR